jgi:hypothetical protein
VKVQGAIPTPDELVLARSPRRSSGKHFAACLKTLAAAIKARWVCEQAHQQMKEALGLDHLEGRSWQGAAPTRALDHDRLCIPATSASQAGEAEKRIHSGLPQPTLPAVRRAVIKALSRKQICERSQPPNGHQNKVVLSSRFLSRRVRGRKTGSDFGSLRSNSPY